ncbi:hypothetical protein RF11_02840 [Thelohanellus kitauei]|uniref:Uncharacterized protein n=1 Tax=Thelohanellus kitauei TaxID=669202 RepID=A0A0C2MM78_THEKT|nr:hypothetical protein RF11_02840 [Thelohanellus kitauei]
MYENSISKIRLISLTMPFFFVYLSGQFDECDQFTFKALCDVALAYNQVRTRFRGEHLWDEEKIFYLGVVLTIEQSENSKILFPNQFNILVGCQTAEVRNCLNTTRSVHNCLQFHGLMGHFYQKQELINYKKYAIFQTNKLKSRFIFIDYKIFERVYIDGNDILFCLGQIESKIL